MRLFLVCVFATVVAFTSAEKSLLEGLVPKDFQISDFINIKRNDYQSNDVEGRTINSIEDNVENYMKTHDFTFKLPLLDSSVTFTGRGLDKNELDVKLRFEGSGSQVEERKKKSKLKKIFVPIFVFILIKAMVMIPLALGILAIKTWNALQLSFGSFVVALAMAVWQLCKKVAGEHVHPHIVAAHPVYEDPHHHIKRAFEEQAQQMAYSAYAPQA